jgi:protein-S-isoprenylcysteine O-methyltransferase Ste14
MKREFLLYLSALLFCIRLYLALRLSASGTVSGLVLCVSALIAIGTTAVAWIEGKPDLSWSGIGVGCLHLVPLMFVVGSTHWTVVAPLFWLLFAVQCWVRVVLGRRCTVTGPVYVSVVSRAPYSWVRHPMTFIELLMTFVFGLEFPSEWNFFVVVASLVAKVVLVLWEERFLREQPEWCRYASWVRYRWVPGIW